MGKLTINLFGPLRVALDGAPLADFDTDKVRALLAYLVVEGGQAHLRGELAELLWPERAEERARHNLSQALYNLRSVLKETNTSSTRFLLVSSGTIQLNPACDCHVDADEFTRLIEVCDRHPHHQLDACHPCLQRMQRAADLYQGEFLAGFAIRDSPEFEEWILLKREHYGLLARRAIAGLAASYERLGQMQDALMATRRLVQLDPYDDGACQALMRLLAACDQRSEALAVYERFRLRLQDDLDLQPEATTRLLYSRIHRTREAQPIQLPRHDNLPASLSPLIGREVELTEVQGCLHDPACRLLTILGPGGSGKSRLALEAARGMLGRFTDGIYLVPLSPLVSLESFLPALAAALGLHIQERKAPLAQLQDYLRGKELLMVLDGFEGLLEGAFLLLELLHSAPELKLLVTSRARLNVAEEQVYQLGGLQYVSATDLEAAALSAAVRLFASGARRLRPEFEIGLHNLRAVSEICADAQGMPLAILLAAAWVEVLSPAEILAEIRLSLDFLQAEWADLPPRQRSVRLTFDYSWDLMDEADREVFRGLCVFRGAFTRQAAQAVCGAGATELRNLADKSLLMLQSGEWYAVHELLRQYGLEKLNDIPAESGRIQQRYSSYYLEKLVEWETGLKGARQVETLAVLDAKINDLRFAWELACERGDLERLNHALEGLCLYYEQRARYREGQSACLAAASHLAGASTPAERLLLALLLAWQSRFHRLLGEIDLAHQKLEEAQALLAGLADSGLDLRRAQGFHHLEAAEQVFTSDLALAQRHLASSLELYRSVGDAWRTAQVLVRLGFNHQLTSDYAGSDNFLTQAISIYQQLGLSAGIATAQRVMAHTMYRTGRAESALDLMYQVIQISQASGDKAQAALDLRTLGASLVLNNHFDEAFSLLGKALAFAEEVGDRYEITFISVVWGMSEQIYGLYALSRPRLLRVLERARSYGFQREQAASLWSLGCIALAEGTPQEAHLFFMESIDLYRQVGHKDELCWALALEAACSLAGGDTGQASRSLGEALEIALSIKSYLAALFSLAAGAVWLAQQEDRERALEIYTLVAGQTLFINSSWFKDVFGQRIAACTASLAAEVAEAARQRGVHRPLWDTVAEMREAISWG